VLVWEWGHAAEVLARERSRADGVLVWEWGRAAEVLARERRADWRGSGAVQTGCWCGSGPYRRGAGARKHSGADGVLVCQRCRAAGAALVWSREGKTCVSFEIMPHATKIAKQMGQT